MNSLSMRVKSRMQRAENRQESVFHYFDLIATFRVLEMDSMLIECAA